MPIGIVIAVAVVLVIVVSSHQSLCNRFQSEEECGI